MKFLLKKNGLSLLVTALGIFASQAEPIKHRSEAAGSTRDVAYICNYSDDTVSVVALDTLTVVGTITVGDGPSAAVSTPDGSRVYVANSLSGNVSVIDTTSGTVTKTITVGQAPASITVSRDGKRVYTANSGSSSISVIDTTLDAVEATVPTPPVPNAIAFHPVRNELWVGFNTSPTVMEVLSATDYSVLASTQSDNENLGLRRAYASHGFAFSSDGSQLIGTEGCGCCGRFHLISGDVSGGNIVIQTPDLLYDNIGTAAAAVVNPATGIAYLAKDGQCSNPKAPYVSEFGGGNRKLVLAETPRGIALSPDGKQLYVTQANSILVINTLTFSSVTNVSVGSLPSSIIIKVAKPQITVTGNVGYVSNYSDDTVSVVALDALTVVGTITVGDGPSAAVSTPDGLRVYVANSLSGNVSVIDTSSGTVTKTIAVGQAPASITVSRDGKRVYTANSGSSSISVIDTTLDAVETTVPTPPVPNAIAFHPVKNELWIGFNTTPTVLEVLSATDYSVLALTQSGNRAYASHGFAFSQDGSEVIGTEGCGCCGRFHQLLGDVSGGNIVIQTPDLLYDNVGTAAAAVVNPATGIAYLAKDGQCSNPKAPYVSELGGGNRKLVLAETPHGIALSPDGKQLYVTQANSILVINTLTFSSLTNVAVGSLPSSIIVKVAKQEIPGEGSKLSMSVACIQLCWPTLVNRTYQVQYTTGSMSFGTWLNLGGPVSGTGNTFCMNDDVIGKENRFYRLIETP